MKDKLKEILTESIKSLEKSKKKDFSDIRIDIKENKEKAFGDYSTNLSLAISNKTNDNNSKTRNLSQNVPTTCIKGNN